MSSIVREALAKELEVAGRDRKRGSALLDLIGIGNDSHDPDRPVSEYHDDYLADALHEELRENAPGPRRRTAARRQKR